jgi:endoribonuclease LACTB2
MSWNQNEHVEPRRAAAVILADARAALEVLLAQRNRDLAFMGGHHVFPGGALEEEDSADRVDGRAEPGLKRLIAAAVRECFEEAGLLLVKEPVPDEAARRMMRFSLLAGEDTFEAMLAEKDLRIDGDAFAPAGLWITPPFSPIRYHTQYFLYRYHGERYEKALGPESEITGLVWMRPAAARRAWHAQDGIQLSTPVAFSLRQLADFPLDTALAHLRDTPGRDDTAPNRFEPRAGIHIIPLRTDTLPPAVHTNCIVAGERDLVVIDPGASAPEEQRHFLDHLAQLMVAGGRIRAVLLTHVHGDHAGCADRVRQEYGAPVWAHRLAADRTAITIDRFLEDKETIDVAGEPAWRLRCLHTPGHCPEHCCFLEESTATLICGDMAANPGTIMISPDHGGDMTRYLESLARLLEEDFEFLVPAHGMPSWRGGAKEHIRQLIDHRLAREAKIRAALDAGAQTEDAMLALAYSDTPRDAWPLAALQLRAHLARLGRKL